MASSGNELIVVLDPGLNRLNADAASMSSAIHAVKNPKHAGGVAHTVSHARHDALSLHASIKAVHTNHPAKGHLLQSFADGDTA